MDDILERLRKAEAEIERLRAALEPLVCTCEGDYCTNLKWLKTPHLNCPRKKGQLALKGEGNAKPD